MERGDTVADFDPQEKAMGHSLHAALVHLEWAGHWINLLDTPGLPDLSGRALVALPAADTAAGGGDQRRGPASRAAPGA